jgi:hypothetical protein
MKFSLPNVKKFNSVGKPKKISYTLLSHRLLPYLDTNDVCIFIESLKSDYFSQILSEIFEKNADIVALQGVYNGHESFISIEGYQSIYYSGQDRKIGYATFWKPEKLELKSHKELDYYMNQTGLYRGETSGALITVFETVNEEAVCIVNSDTNQIRHIGQYQTYLLLIQLKPLYDQYPRVLLTGLYYESKPILCSKSQIPPGILSKLQDTIFEIKQNKIAVYCKSFAKNNSFEYLNNFACIGLPAEVYYKGEVTIMSSRSFTSNSIYLEFNLN